MESSPAIISSGDYVVIESTYGNRLHRTNQESREEFRQVMVKALRDKAKVFIPSFVVDRAQRILYELSLLQEEGILDEKTPLFFDSPMGVKATEIYKRNVNILSSEIQQYVNRGKDPFSPKRLTYDSSVEESQAINFETTPKVIISASGMCDAGRIKHHLKHNLWREESTILFVGYQSVGTLGRSIVDGAEQVKLFGEPIDVHAEVLKLEGLSGHADKNGLIDWLQGFEAKPQKVFIVHGEDSVATSFAECLKTEYGYDTYAPYSGTEYDLAAGSFIREASPMPCSFSMVRTEEAKESMR